MCKIKKNLFFTFSSLIFLFISFTTCLYVQQVNREDDLKKVYIRDYVDALIESRDFQISNALTYNLYNLPKTDNDKENFVVISDDINITERSFVNMDIKQKISSLVKFDTININNSLYRYGTFYDKNSETYFVLIKALDGSHSIKFDRKNLTHITINYSKINSAYEEIRNKNGEIVGYANYEITFKNNDYHYMITFIIIFLILVNILMVVYQFKNLEV